jgi:hypothetical protein
MKLNLCFPVVLMRVRLHIGDNLGYWSTCWTGSMYESVDGCTMGLQYVEYGFCLISNSYGDLETTDIWQN